MEIVLGVVVVVVALYFIAAPFLNEESAQVAIATENDSVTNAKESYIKNLEDLEADLRMHKISEEDYTKATEEVKKEAGKLLE